MTATIPTPARADWFSRLARRAVTAKLRNLRSGCLTITDDAARSEERFGDAAATDPVHIRVTDPAFWVDLMCRGSVGAAEAWVDGHWTTDDLIAVIRMFVRNREVLESMEGGIARLSAPLLRGFHRLHRNTRRGSKRNIAAHYDLGNDFFARFLDPTMTYSSALFETPDATLEQASIAKLDRLCRKLDLGPQDHLVEIGTGWGSMAIHAAENYGCRVTTTTISRQQFELARDRIRARGLEDRIELLERDYRDLEGEYDKLVSVEMIEAVGHDHLNEYMAKCGSLLKPDGAAALQVITIQDQLYEQAVREVDFIKRYIFPGSFIPCVSAVSRSMASHTDMRLFHLEDTAPHYAATLERWRENLFANRDAILDAGYSESFLRLWDYYLCYCAGGFHERQLGVAQIVFHKPECRLDPIVPPIAQPRPRRRSA